MILFLDACALIYWLETVERFYRKLIAALRTIYEQDPHTKIAMSRLSQLECLVKPLQTNDQALIQSYRAYFASPDLHIVELNAAVMEQAAILRASHKGFTYTGCHSSRQRLIIARRSVISDRRFRV